MATNWFVDHYTLLVVSAGSSVLGTVAGALGCFAYLRKQSLLGDSVSHAALPGIALAFLITGSKTTLFMLLGASVAGWLGALLVQAVIRTSRIKEDAAMGLMLSSFFGFGLVLLSLIQKQSSSASQAGLDRYLFGQAAGMLQSDVLLLASIGASLLLCLALFWKQFKLLAFDPDFGQTLGWNMRIWDILLTSLLVTAIVLGLQTVGVVLMSAMVVAPAAAARQWTECLGRMIAIAACFGGLAGLLGALASSSIPKIPTGPSVVLVLSLIVAISLLFAPSRGIVAALYRRRRQVKLLTSPIP